MTQAELYAALSELTFWGDDSQEQPVPVAYQSFIEATEPPFICYLFTMSADIAADDINYVPVSGFDVELYTAKKDLALEADLEAVLQDLGLVWVKSETYIDTERLIEVVYSVQVVPSASDDSSV